MKKWLLKSNEWYDTRKEPGRFLIFYIPVLFLLVFLNFGSLKMMLGSVLVMFVMLAWRISPKFLK